MNVTQETVPEFSPPDTGDEKLTQRSDGRDATSGPILIPIHDALALRPATIHAVKGYPDADLEFLRCQPPYRTSAAADGDPPDMSEPESPSQEMIESFVSHVRAGEMLPDTDITMSSATGPFGTATMAYASATEPSLIVLAIQRAHLDSSKRLRDQIDRIESIGDVPYSIIRL